MREQLRRAGERLTAVFSVPQPAVAGFGALRGCAWALWVFNHPALFQKYAVFFRPLQDVAPPWLWGVGALALGLLQFWGLAFGNRPVRRFCTMAACIGWLFLAHIYWRGDADSLGIPLLLCDAASAGWSFLRLGQNYGQDDGGTP